MNEQKYVIFKWLHRPGEDTGVLMLEYRKDRGWMMPYDKEAHKTGSNDAIDLPGAYEAIVRDVRNCISHGNEVCENVFLCGASDAYDEPCPLGGLWKNICKTDVRYHTRRGTIRAMVKYYVKPAPFETVFKMYRV